MTEKPSMDRPVLSEAKTPVLWSQVRGRVIGKLENLWEVWNGRQAVSAVIEGGEKILEPKHVIGTRVVREAIRASGVPQEEVESLVTEALHDKDVLEILGDVVSFGDEIRKAAGIKSARISEYIVDVADELADTVEVPVVDEEDGKK